MSGGKPIMTMFLLPLSAILRKGVCKVAGREAVASMQLLVLTKVLYSEKVKYKEEFSKTLIRSQRPIYLPIA